MAKTLTNLTAQQVRNLLSYEEETGLFRWLRSERSIKAGQVAGRKSVGGYIYIQINGSRYLAHRVAWLWMTGEWPRTDHVDHRDGNTANNRWLNLRPATCSQNLANQKRSASNTSGIKGVHWDKVNRKWIAQIMKDQRCIFLGRHSTIEAASKAYSSAAAELFGEFARTE